MQHAEPTHNQHDYIDPINAYRQRNTIIFAASAFLLCSTIVIAPDPANDAGAPVLTALTIIASCTGMVVPLVANLHLWKHQRTTTPDPKQPVITWA